MALLLVAATVSGAIVFVAPTRPRATAILLASGAAIGPRGETPEDKSSERRRRREALEFQLNQTDRFVSSSF